MKCRKYRSDPISWPWQAQGNRHEQTAFRRLAARVTWEQIVRSIEQVKGQKWEQFCQTYGDWGRDAALWLGRKRGGLTLARLGQLAGGVDYAAVAQAVTRFGQRLERQRALRQSLNQIEYEMSKV